MARFERIHPPPAEWDTILNSFADRNVFQTSAWLAFLAEDQNGEPVIAALREQGDTLGYFVGVIVRKAGLKILGSPFRGWSTAYMGFVMRPDVARRVAVQALPEFAFRQLGCLHVEVVDPLMTPADVEGLGLGLENCASLELDLTQTEDALFSGLTKSCRWTVRKAEKNGVTIEEATDPGFAGDYAAQLRDVFDKQGLNPHYGAARVRTMMKHVLGSGMLLLLRARGPDGACLASGIFPATNTRGFFLGGASWRHGQKLYPNELLQWHLIRRLKARGIQIYNLVGTMEYKQKFGGKITSVPMIVHSRYPWLAWARRAAPKLMRSVLAAAWKVKSLRRPAPSAKSKTVGEPPTET